METVWSLVIDVIVAAAAGFAVWASDRRHGKYGIMLPVAVAVTAACVVWIVLVGLGTGYTTGLTWMPWVLPMLVSIAAPVAVAAVLVRRRTKADTDRLTEILKR
ncbi:hypothetical protein [Sinomonas mesophila]|uniref:hypothetical protein n=1 Tax=Sinomonas mesophila TaxID=1531955 RepID=UPI000984B7FE|nr:hypothetical protein [Sinomonas mesophila]